MEYHPFYLSTRGCKWDSHTEGNSIQVEMSTIRMLSMLLPEPILFIKIERRSFCYLIRTDTWYCTDFRISLIAGPSQPALRVKKSVVHAGMGRMVFSVVIAESLIHVGSLIRCFVQTSRSAACAACACTNYAYVSPVLSATSGNEEYGTLHDNAEICHIDG